MSDYNPLLYKNLGFPVEQQLLYSSAWLTFTLGLSVLAMPLIDRVPRNKLTAVGLWGCMSALIVEAALIANFVPSDNHNALRAAVAMLFVFQIPDTMMLNGKHDGLTEWSHVRLSKDRARVGVPWRDVSHAHSIERLQSSHVRLISCQHHLYSSRTDGLRVSRSKRVSR